VTRSVRGIDDDRNAPLPLFVYGTLRSGGSNHSIFERGVLDVTPATTNGALYHLRAGYPALVLDRADVVYGELLTFRDPAAALARSDALEDARPDGRGQYLRVRVEARTVADLRAVTAWTDIYDAERLRREPAAVRVASGVWPPAP
jgi:gamma-glutamylcyclotransferase (GGCT)/AIG2-like uncharacterized protein YtfP